MCNLKTTGPGRTRAGDGPGGDDFKLPTDSGSIAVLPTFCFPRKVWRVVIRGPRNSLYTSKRAFDMFSGKCHILNRGRARRHGDVRLGFRLHVGILRHRLEFHVKMRQCYGWDIETGARRTIKKKAHGTLSKATVSSEPRQKSESERRQSIKKPKCLE